jgi:hypothetical protein
VRIIQKVQSDPTDAYFPDWKPQASKYFPTEFKTMQEAFVLCATFVHIQMIIN